MATLLGKYGGAVSMYDTFAKIAFNRALDYLPDANFVYIDYRTICDEDRVTFNDSGISGSCVDGCGVKVYTFKMPSENKLFIYHATYWYITIKCRKPDGIYNYVEFSFDNVNYTHKRREIHAF